MTKVIKGLILSAFAAAFAFLAVGCNDDDSPAQIYSLKMNITSANLSVGETVQLWATPDPADADITLTWTSSNEDVATVSDEGLATAVGFGSAQITARYHSYFATCSIIVSSGSSDDPDDDEPVSVPLLDPTAALAAPLSESIIYSQGVLLYSTNRIMQGFDLASDGSIYYSQTGAGAVPVNVCRATGPNENARTEYMLMNYFGHGTQIAVEEADDGKTYIWLDSNGTYLGDDGYGDNFSFSRVEFTPGATYDNYAGDTFFLNRNREYDQQVSIDFVSRRLLVGSRGGSGGRHFWVFDLDEVMDLPLKKMTVTTTIGSETLTYDVDARDLGDLTELGNFTIPAGTNKETDVYSYSHQGHEIWGNYIYFYEGNAEGSGSSYQSKAYVTVFDYFGNIVCPRTEVVAIADLDGLKNYGFTTIGYAEGEGIKIRDGKLYLGIACRESSGNRYAEILVYDCVAVE